MTGQADHRTADASVKQALIEEVAGQTFPQNYRNRVSYGAKILVRLGPQHMLVLNVPTGNFLTDPKRSDLPNLDEIVRILSGLVSYRYPHALIPLVLANSAASISQRPSGPILKQFLDSILS